MAKERGQRSQVLRAEQDQVFITHLLLQSMGRICRNQEEPEPKKTGRHGPSQHVPSLPKDVKCLWDHCVGSASYQLKKFPHLQKDILKETIKGRTVFTGSVLISP